MARVAPPARPRAAPRQNADAGAVHPDRAFAIDAAACRRLATEIGFAHVFVTGAHGPAVIHAPLVADGAGDLAFHLARRNRACPLADGAVAIASLAGPVGYISPDWYVTPGQVPTWNYVAVEAEGTIEPLDRAALIAQVDALGDDHEARLSPKPAWTRDKMPDGRFDAMLGGIVGYRLRVTAWRGTAKLSQNKPSADVAAVVAALRATGRADLAALMERPPGR